MTRSDWGRVASSEDEGMALYSGAEQNMELSWWENRIRESRMLNSGWKKS